MRPSEVGWPLSRRYQPSNVTLRPRVRPSASGCARSSFRGTRPGVEPPEPRTRGRGGLHPIPQQEGAPMDRIWGSWQCIDGCASGRWMRRENGQNGGRHGIICMLYISLYQGRPRAVGRPPAGGTLLGAEGAARRPEPRDPQTVPTLSTSFARASGPTVLSTPTPDPRGERLRQQRISGGNSAPRTPSGRTQVRTSHHGRRSWDHPAPSGRDRQPPPGPPPPPGSGRPTEQHRSDPSGTPGTAAATDPPRRAPGPNSRPPAPEIPVGGLLSPRRGPVPARPRDPRHRPPAR
jgi:hypothetical protein